MLLDHGAQTFHKDLVSDFVFIALENIHLTPPSNTATAAESTTQFFKTALHDAAADGRVAVVRVLVEHGALCDEPDKVPSDALPVDVVVDVAMCLALHLLGIFLQLFRAIVSIACECLLWYDVHVIHSAMSSIHKHRHCSRGGLGGLDASALRGEQGTLVCGLRARGPRSGSRTTQLGTMIFSTVPMHMSPSHCLCSSPPGCWRDRTGARRWTRRTRWTRTRCGGEWSCS